MSASLWFVAGAVVGTFALVVAGALKLAIDLRAFVSRANRISLPQIDAGRARAAIAKIQSDLEAMTALFTRAGVALQTIDASLRALRAMIRALVPR